jgi:hypothetical protein
VTVDPSGFVKVFWKNDAMVRWKTAGELDKPNGSTFHWYRPDGVRNAVFLTSTGVQP